MIQADKKRFGNNMDHLSDSFLEGSFLNPTSVADAMKMLSERSANSKPPPGGGNNNGNGGNGKGKGGRNGKGGNETSSQLVQKPVVRAYRPEDEDLIEEEIEGDGRETKRAY